MSYKINEGLRMELKEPLGKLIPNNEINQSFFTELKNKRIITVGDRTTEVISSAGVDIMMEIVDGRERRVSRNPPESHLQRQLIITNPPGEITAQAVDTIRKCLKDEQKVRIYVDGEEDLLTLPSIYYSDLGGLVLYGQPGQGMVLVRVDGSSKERAKRIMNEMGISL
ncbi:MAG: DUF359 domain-containing protein [Nitrososphaerota archaeon]|nr:DUF359 domain-containing protein [Nitrososphaerota archaeon]MDG7046424.1 DUF359 domain-containing protein [Nitrososphaerota archaeon]